MNNIRGFLYILVGGSFLVALFQNCSDTKFERAPEKAAVLENAQVFDDLPPAPTPNPPPPVPGPNVAIPIKSVCGQQTGATIGTNVLDSDGIKAVMVDVDNPDNKCETLNSQYLKNDLIAGRNIVFPNCDMKGDEKVKISLVNSKGQSLLMDYTQGKRYSSGERKTQSVTRQLNINDKGVMATSFNVLDVMVANKNPSFGDEIPMYQPIEMPEEKMGWNDPRLYSDDGSEGGMVNSGISFVSLEDLREPATESPKKAIEACDKFDSPLVIDFRPKSRRGSSFLDLSAPWEGIMFNIKGQNAAVPNEKTKISWFKSSRTSASFAFLALPDRNGQVNGIDQLFGNNTMGPDGRIAAHGFQALTKFDGKVNKSAKDGYIDEKDAIYSKLRLWSDVNLDGEAQRSELISLEDAGVAVIDLNYDTSFYERDRYGNEARFKTVIKMKDGTLFPMFDLWFRQ